MRTVLGLTIFFHCCSLLLFTVSFLHVPISNEEISSFRHIFDVFPDNETAANKIRTIYKPRFSKLVFVLVDALRADFIPSVLHGVHTNETTMPFVENMLRNRLAVAYVGEAQAPTVTLPRIKAMMTGSIPSFADVITNLKAEGLKEDSFLLQSSRLKKKIVFYGDDTWIKVFPTVFSRKEGTTSFFVADYTEVDNNVTHNLQKEFNRSDWDMMFLHYLGLDHIGHLATLRSNLVKPKLKEMDDAIKYIFSKSNNSTLIVLCSDHGMTIGGSHGGVSLDEILVPFVVIPVPSPVTTVRSHRVSTKIQQVDIASTLSVLFGLPIPINNMGKIITELMDLCGMLPSEQLFALHYNLLQLSKMMQRKNIVLSSSVTQLLQSQLIKFENIRATHFIYLREKYVTVLKDMGNALKSTVTEHNLYGMTVGIAIGVIAVILAACSLSKWPEGFLEIFVLFANLGYAVSLFSSSFIEEEHQTWYFLTQTLLLLLVTSFLRIKALKNFLLYSIILILFRVARAWNRTGNKWIHLPDIADCFQNRETLLKIVVSFSLLIIGMFQVRKIGKIYNALIIVWLLLVCDYKTSFIKRFFNYEAALAIYVLCSVPMCTAIANFPFEHSKMAALKMLFKGSSSSWCLLSIFLLRPPNIPLYALIVLLEKLVKKITWKMSQSSFLCTTTYVWLGICSFFFQGNSNMFSTIDISAGYTGLSSYNPVLVGSLLLVNTYSFLVFWLLECLYNVCESNRPLSASRGTNFLILFKTVSSCSLMLCLFILRYHLFVWTVFAPKLLYEGVFSIIMSVFLLALSLCHGIQKYSNSCAFV